MTDERNKVGTKASMVAIVSNCILTAMNISIGIICGSYALFAEGIHTFTDIITSIIAYVGFKIGQKPADEEHPRGYGRAEALSGLVILLFLVIVGYEIIDTAIEKILDPSLIKVPDIHVATVALLGVFLNFFISRYIIKIGRQINSPAIEADGQHQRTDIYTSIVILIGVVAANSGFPMLDPIIGLGIGVLILKTAFVIGKKNIDYILGKINDKDMIEKIKTVAEEIPGAYEAHNIKIDNYGAYIIVSLHIKVDGNLTVYEAHKIVHKVEENLLKIPSIKSVAVHACPLDLEYEHKQKIDF